MAVDTICHAQQRGSGRRITASEGKNCLEWKGSYLRSTFRRKLHDTLEERLPANSVCRNPVRPVKAFRHHYMHQSKRKRRIGARKRLYMLVSGTSGQRANGINDNHTGTLALGFSQKGHDMRCSAGRIAAPDQDQLTKHQHLGRGSQATTYREHDGLFGSTPAYASFELPCSQAIPQTAFGAKALTPA